MQNLIFSVKIHPSTNSFTSHECVHSLHEITSNWIYFLSQPVHKRYLSTRMVCTESGFMSATEKYFQRFHMKKNINPPNLSISISTGSFHNNAGFCCHLFGLFGSILWSFTNSCHKLVHGWSHKYLPY